MPKGDTMPKSRSKDIDNRIFALEKLLNDGRPKSKLETAAIHRQMEDLLNGHKRGLYWDEGAVQHVVKKIFGNLRHWKGDLAGKPFTPTPWQEHLLIAPIYGWYYEGKLPRRRKVRHVYVEIAKKNGKMLSVHTKVPTPDGWTTMGDLKAGHIVFDKDGNKCKVSIAHPFDLKPESYKVTFSNGEVIEACADHLWHMDRVSDYKESKSKVEREIKKREDNIWTTKEMFATGTRCVESGTFGFLMHNGLIKLEEKKLPIEPYKAGFVGDHITSVYLRGSLLQRLALLQGLMDAGGKVSPNGNQYEYVNTSDGISKKVTELLSTLGIVYNHNKVLEGSGNGYNLILFSTRLTVFRANKRTINEISRDKVVYIESIEPIDPVPMRCITVNSPSGTYLVGETMMPTHNTSTCAAVAANALLGEGRSGGQVWAAAAKKDQARKVFEDCSEMLLASKFEGLDIQRSKILYPRRRCSFNIATSEAGGEDGMFVDTAIIDELHRWKSGDLYHVIRGGIGKAPNPLIFSITTAGSNKATICWDKHQQAEYILLGGLENQELHSYDDTWAYITCAEDDDDIMDPDIWWKANPNLDISVDRNEMASLARDAARNPNSENSFRRLHLNQWTSQVNRWIPMATWRKNTEEINFDHLAENYECKAALDLSSTKDVTALSLVWYVDGEYYTWNYYWIPKEAKCRRGENDRTKIMDWAERHPHLIRKQPGDTINHRLIIKDLKKIMQWANIRKLAFDPWGRENLLNDCEEDAEFNDILSRRGLHHEDWFVEYRQSMANLCNGTKAFERAVFDGRYHHNGDPILDWMIDNVQIKEDEAGNIRPNKAKSADKIDAVVTNVMAVGLWINDTEDSVSMYDTPGNLSMSGQYEGLAIQEDELDDESFPFF